jgi:hypothetical protein
MARADQRTERMRWVDQSGEDWKQVLEGLVADEQRKSQLCVSDTLSTLGSLWLESAPTVR